MELLVVLSDMRANQSDSCPALRQINRQAYGTRLSGYLCTLRRYFRNVDVADDLSISPNKAGRQLFIARSP